MNKITPFGTRILIQPVEKQSGPVADVGSLCEYGKVIAVGGDVIKIHPGDTIGFLKWGVESLSIEGEKYYFVDETSEFVLCTIENESSEQ